jgi:hypothetical protein
MTECGMDAGVKWNIIIKGSLEEFFFISIGS